MKTLLIIKHIFGTPTGHYISLLDSKRKQQSTALSITTAFLKQKMLYMHYLLITLTLYYYSLL